MGAAPNAQLGYRQAQQPRQMEQQQPTQFTPVNQQIGDKDPLAQTTMAYQKKPHKVANFLDPVKGLQCFKCYQINGDTWEMSEKQINKQNSPVCHVNKDLADSCHCIDTIDGSPVRIQVDSRAPFQLFTAGWFWSLHKMPDPST